MNYAHFGQHLTQLYGMADDQVAREKSAQLRLKRAITEMQLAIEDVNTSSALVKIDAETFDNLIHDEFPNFDAWIENLASARH